MFKKCIVSISLILMLTLLVVGCSDKSNSLVDKDEYIHLEKSLEDSNNMLRESKNMTDEAKTVIELLTRENEVLVKDLESSKDKIMALEIIEEPLPLALSPYPGMTVLVAATNVLDAMSSNDYLTLSLYVDPVDGVYLSPYQYIDFSYTMNLSDYEILNLATIPTIYPWGNEPGSGDLISLSILDYFNEYVYDENYYIAPIVGMNIVVSSGNMINNISSSFPTSDTVEFLFPEFNPSYGGLDWSSITLVFNTDSGMPMLLGIVHGQWTP